MRRLAIALLAAAGFGSQVSAQPTFNPTISDEMVVGLSGAVLDGLPSMKCAAGPCAPATSAERANGMIPLRDAREIIRKGMVSQIAECAEVDWETMGFRPLMADWRHGRKASDRQLAFVAALHGAGMGVAKNAMGGSCPKKN